MLQKTPEILEEPWVDFLGEIRRRASEWLQSAVYGVLGDRA